MSPPLTINRASNAESPATTATSETIEKKREALKSSIEKYNALAEEVDWNHNKDKESEVFGHCLDIMGKADDLASHLYKSGMLDKIMTCITGSNQVKAKKEAILANALSQLKNPTPDCLDLLTRTAKNIVTCLPLDTFLRAKFDEVQQEYVFEIDRKGNFYKFKPTLLDALKTKNSATDNGYPHKLQALTDKRFEVVEWPELRKNKDLEIAIRKAEFDAAAAIVLCIPDRAVTTVSVEILNMLMKGEPALKDAMSALKEKMVVRNIGQIGMWG